MTRYVYVIQFEGIAVYSSAAKAAEQIRKVFPNWRIENYGRFFHGGHINNLVGSQLLTLINVDYSFYLCRPGSKDEAKISKQPVQ